MADKAQGIKWLSEAVGEIARLYDARAIPSNANRALIEELVRKAVVAIFPAGSAERDAYAAFKLGSAGVAFARDPRVAIRNALGNAKSDLASLLRKTDSVPTDAATEPAVAIPERVPMTHSVGTAGFQATVFRVLIASPGDAVDDRETVRQSIHDWNDLHAVQRRIVLLPVMVGDEVYRAARLLKGRCLDGRRV